MESTKIVKLHRKSNPMPCPSLPDALGIYARGSLSKAPVLLVVRACALGRPCLCSRSSVLMGIIPKFLLVFYKKNFFFFCLHIFFPYLCNRKIY